MESDTAPADLAHGGHGTPNWLVDDIAAWLNGFLDTDRLLAIAWRVGAAAADLHTALSGSRRSTVGARTYAIAATAALDEALATVVGEEGARLRAQEAAVRSALEPLRTDRLLPAHRVHGDLVVTRFHAVETDLLVEPPAPPPTFEPELPQSPLTDLATLLQSVDHSGRIAARRSGRDVGDRVERLDELVLDAVLQAYTAVHGVDTTVLHALRVWAELRAHLQAVGRPSQRWLPDVALPVLLARGAR